MREQRYVDTYHVKSPEYRDELLRLKAEGMCPFCWEYFSKRYAEQVIRHEGNCFLAILSFPYKDTDHHLMIIPDEHKEFPEDFTTEEWGDILILLNIAIEMFDVPGGAIAMRFGDPRHTGATVLHLHMHIIVPQLGEDDRAKLVNFPIG